VTRHSANVCVEFLSEKKMAKRKAVVLSDDLSAAKMTSLLQSLKRRKVYRTKRRSVAKKGISAKPLISRFAQHPFPKEWRTKITWDPPTWFSNNSSTNNAGVIRVNDLFDPDYSNVFGNGQPLFTDQMISATGPYQRFRVDGWKAKIEISNVSPAGTDGTLMPIDVYLMQGANNGVDVDTFAELQSSPGVITDMIGPAGSAGSKSQKTFYLNGRTSAYIPPGTKFDDDYIGDYATSPAKPLYLGIGCKIANGADTSYVKFFVKLQLELDVVFFARDAVAS